MEWFKFYGGEYLSDPKMLMLTACERSCWMTLLSFASVAEDGGRVKYLSEPQLMTAANVSPMHEEWDLTVGVLKKFEELGMIEQSNGIITVKNWGKRQESYLTNAQRQARFRDKRKSNAEITDVLLQSNARIEENRIEENNTFVISKESQKQPLRSNLDGFESWWNVFPRKANKTGASAEWRKLTAEERAEANKGAERVKKFSHDPKFVPMPDKWLANKRWEDELPAYEKPRIIKL